MATTGTITRLLVDKGFGFIARADGVEFFFHRSAVKGKPGTFETMFVNQVVTFGEGDGAKGPRAEKVSVE